MIEVENVSLHTKHYTILEEVSLTVEPGNIVGLIGTNGSGKTMLMKCICGFNNAFTGNIRVMGKELGKDVDFPPSTGLIIETPGFVPYHSGYKNLKMLADLRGRIGRDEVREIMEKVGLEPDLRRHVRKYSLGMRQRLGLAQALMENPDVLILDEPLNGLDKEMTAIIRDVLLKEKEKGKTILLSSHNQLDIELLCDKVYEMEKGKLSLYTPEKESSN